MSVLELPKSSKPTIAFALIALAIALYRVCAHDGANPWLGVAAFLLSGFIGDLFTGFAHFGFDYIFPEDMPILGPVAKEFREHHDCPTLDPTDYVVNFTKGAYCSLPLSLIVIALASPHHGWISFLAIATLLGMSFWAFFFHQIHSYAHMGSSLSPDEFKQRVAMIGRLPTEAEQKREFARLFETVPIPPAVRFLQRCRLILNPATHNLHHIQFESDFSSVNGWSDPVSNLILRPISRRLKARAAQA